MLDLSQLDKAINRILSTPVTTGDANQTPFSGLDLLKLSQLLKDSGKAEWAIRPRIYAILHLIGQQAAIEGFVAEGILDISLPIERESRLPFTLKTVTARKAFVELQSRVLTAAADVEKKPGTHQILKNGDYYYETKADLGSGSFGSVDHVWSTLSLQSFARKRIRRKPLFRQDQEAITAFINELKVLQKVSHRHLVEFVGSYTDTNFIAIIMRPVAKTDLKEYLRITPFPRENLHQLRKFFGCLAIGVRYLHRNSIRHKDIKPSNILITHGGEILITDFGASLDWTENGKSTTQGSRRDAFTPEYCAPEVIAYEPCNSLSDIYSLGCVYFEMLTLLKGETIQLMRQFFTSSGTRSMVVRTNLVVANAWLDRLLATSSDEDDNITITWTRRMIAPRSDDRPSSEEVASWTIGTANASRFCCLLCMDEDEMHSQDESLPLHLAEEPKGRDPSTAKTFSRDLLPNLNADSSIDHILGPIASTDHSRSSLSPALDLNSILSPSQSRTSEILQPKLQQQFSKEATRNITDWMSLVSRNFNYDKTGAETSEYQANIPSHRPEKFEKLMPRNASNVRKSDVRKDLTSRDKTEKETRISRANGSSSRSGSPAHREFVNLQEVTSQATKLVDPKLVEAFKEYAKRQEKRAQEKPVQEIYPKKSLEDKEKRIAEPKKFANSFKLSSPMPEDVARILGKDLHRQEAESPSLSKAAVKPSLPKTADKPSFNSQYWTKDDEAQLKELKMLDKTWGQIAKSFPDRTKSSIKKHWFDMANLPDRGNPKEITNSESNGILDGP